jgi:hypothetical protein
VGPRAGLEDLKKRKFMILQGLEMLVASHVFKVTPQYGPHGEQSSVVKNIYWSVT